MPDIPEINVPTVIRIKSAGHITVLSLSECLTATDILSYIKISKNCLLPTEDLIL
jgi:hypothetical protein